MPDGLDIRIVAFDDLTLRELHAVLMVRSEVFVVDQKICAVSEVDDDDPRCLHAIAQLDGWTVATARLLPADGVYKVGRVAVLKECRGTGVGSAVMRAVQAWLNGRPGMMSAQAHLEAWYTTLGWRRVGEVYEEAGIPHLRMVYEAPS